MSDERVSEASSGEERGGGRAEPSHGDAVGAHSPSTSPQRRSTIFFLPPHHHHHHLPPFSVYVASQPTPPTRNPVRVAPASLAWRRKHALKCEDSFFFPREKSGLNLCSRSDNMKKFNIRKVLDGLKEASSSSSSTFSSSSAPSVQVGPQDNHLVQENLQSEHFQLCKTVRHGFPYQPSSMAFDPVQKILAIGTQRGALRLFGRPGVESYCQHESEAAVIQLQFLINEGALVSALADDTVHLWNLRQKRPAILHSLKFSKERITFCHLPFQSKWLYIGTERGNVHIVNVESFMLSGYVIMWNKAIELSSKAHPGPVVHISDNPMDEGKLIIGYESGIVVLWDLKSKKADYRYTYDEAIHSVAWHHEGKQFTCSHSDGTLTIWNVRGQGKPIQTITPHGKQPKDGKKPEPCKPILKVEYKTTRIGEPFIILSGGLSYDTVGRRPCLTVMHGKSTAVLEMDYPIVDFLTLCETPYPNDFQEPYAVVVLLEKDLVVIDLAQNGYPIFENPYPLSIHESPVTCCEYLADCPVDLIPALYSVGSRQKRQGYSKKEWPISGGNWGQGTQSYPEIIITGHADGTVKFWDASAMMLQVLYKLKTAKVFDRNRSKEDKGSTEVSDEDPFAIQLMTWCPESRMLCVAGVSANIIIYRFSKLEVTTEVVQLLEVRMQYELNDMESPEGGSGEQTSAGASPQTSGPPSHPSTSSNNSDGSNMPCLKVRSTQLKQSPGYQVDLVVQLVWVSGEPPHQITSLALNSSYGLVVFGNSNGLAVVDYIQKTIVLNMATVELYGSNDPYQRQPRSPRKSRQPSGGLCDINEGSATSEDRCKSPTSVLMTNSNLQQFYNGAGRGAKMSRKLSLPTELKPDLDHRDNSFSRSRSSSVTSIDKEAKEALLSFQFCETFARKGDSTLSPCLYVGTSLGSVMALAIMLPPAGEQRQLQPVILSPTGMLIRLKGSIMRLAFMDSAGSLLPPANDPWFEPNVSVDGEEREKVRKRRPVSVSPSSSQDLNEGQYAVACSEKQAKVLSLPTQTCIYKHSITETSFILRADVVQMSNGVCLACFCANGHIMTLSLPGLRPLMDVNYLPLTDMRIARTFCFTNLGQAMYMCSPTEVQRITYSQDTCENLQEMLGELFTPVETPEAPNRGFFKGLFGGGAQSLDREELFGELAAGRASRSLAQHMPGPGGIEGMKGAASGVVGDLARARIALDERGQKLGELDERTAAMMASADSFSKHAHDMMLKCKDKKWYQF
ncbi:syntaxin-binding protein 5a isoform X10 [Entelurus aequoreus]|uniref:syntaxin-binding protein 5a isoform X10 n=1 Tax=Entelurus aequoreus TaxID=161455 RepID=UPI002B1D90D9|nr:syntaxin-binding protein 5a isoform X10 [Entelurus aequoreus]